MSAPSVLFDLPGPKARRRHRIGAVLVIAVAAVFVYIAVRRLADRGQFDGELWSPLFNPGHEDFADVWNFIWLGLQSTLYAAGIAIAGALVIGTVIGSTRILLSTSRTGRLLRIPLVVVMELLRGLPVVITILLTFTFFRYIDFRLDFLPGEELMWYVAVGLILYNSVIIAEILRAGVASLPRGQAEAARAIGLSEGATMRLVLLPQAFRIMLPALISQLVVVLKDTSLGLLIGFHELLWRSNRLAQLYDNPLQALATAGVIYILINYALSRVAVWTESRVSHAAGGRKAAAKTEKATGAITGG
ncbi:amino acid ABC transporter permease [Nocardioides cavernaquae]|uniref:Amino acid ABC transporter permease n=1 Tax=Nocardioides cavernaquae TaxID=2321396 RepID=A0A3A5H7K5_9ACTN|nr:amino acid ABC transporter permease [Nocardioides cavernaquae]RJS46432.1 amino acid ABC transporter permease [Nocardioides cavernaquae]